jgi:hypothetical protein
MIDSDKKSRTGSTVALHYNAFAATRNGLGPSALDQLVICCVYGTPQGIAGKLSTWVMDV